MSQPNDRSRTGVMIVGASLVSALAVSAVVYTSSTAALGGSAASTTDRFGAATVVLADDDGGSALFDVGGLLPGQTERRCLEVVATGTAPALGPTHVRAMSSGELADDLSVEISHRAAGEGCGDDDVGWHPVFRGPLIGLGLDGARGAVGPVPARDVPVAYRIAVTLDPDASNDVQGQTARVDFVWEVRGG